jgi:hypothetical protein
MENLKRIFKDFYKELQKWGKAAADATQNRN